MPGRSLPWLIVASGHDAQLAAVLAIATLLIRAAVAIVMVILVKREERVHAIHAATDVLAALLPWHPPPAPAHSRPPPDSKAFSVIRRRYGI